MLTLLLNLAPKAQALPHSPTGLFVQSLSNEPRPSRVHGTAILNLASIAADFRPRFQHEHGGLPECNDLALTSTDHDFHRLLADRQIAVDRDITIRVLLPSPDARLRVFVRDRVQVPFRRRQKTEIAFTVNQLPSPREIRQHTSLGCRRVFPGMLFGYTAAGTPSGADRL